MEMKVTFRENRGGKALCPVERFGPGELQADCMGYGDLNKLHTSGSEGH